MTRVNLTTRVIAALRLCFNAAITLVAKSLSMNREMILRTISRTISRTVLRAVLRTASRAVSNTVLGTVLRAIKIAPDARADGFATRISILRIGLVHRGSRDAKNGLKRP